MSDFSSLYPGSPNQAIPPAPVVPLGSSVPSSTPPSGIPPIVQGTQNTQEPLVQSAVSHYAGFQPGAATATTTTAVPVGVPASAYTGYQNQAFSSSAQAAQPYRPFQALPPAQPVYPYQNAPQRSATVPSRAKKGSSPALAFVMGLFGILVGAALTFGTLFVVTGGFLSNTTAQPPATQGSQITINPPSEDASLAEAVAAKTLPSVVNIDVFTESRGGYYNDFTSGTQGSGDLEQYGLGSGIVISNDGYILTNYHVVEGGTEYLVRFDQDTQYKATVVGQDPSSDLAVLKIDATGLIPIEIGDSGLVKVGEWVMALGSPYGLEKSVSTGIVSALFRSTSMQSTTGANYYANMIQTDAAINPGNSGGALVNAKGELIGINTLISSYSGASSGVGFAIPSNYAMNVARQIMEGKEVEHAYLGVQLKTIDAGNAKSLNSNVESGAYIGVVVGGSPADLAGLKEGDIITKLDNTRVSSAAELVINVRGYLVGDVVTLEIQRNGTAQTIEVKLGSDKTA